MIKLKVNGKNQQFDGDPETPLLWVLRDELNLKGTKFGCGFGMCGACKNAEALSEEEAASMEPRPHERGNGPVLSPIILRTCRGFGE